MSTLEAKVTELLLQQVQEVCDRVGLFSNGKMVLHGTVPELGKKVLGKAYRVDLEVANPSPELSAALQEISGVVNVETHGGRLEVETVADLRAEVAAAVVNHGGRLLMLGIESQSLDTIYTHYFEEAAHGKRSL